MKRQPTFAWTRAPAPRLEDLAARFGWTAPGDATPPTAAAVASDLPPPYEDRGPLGRGGMGVVRRVWDPRLLRTAALKSLAPEHAARPELAARFVAEAELTAQLTHPGVIPVYEVGSLGDGRPYYVMKEVSGRTLSEVVAEAHRAGLDEPVLRRLVDHVRRIAETVAYAHARGVVHRDLKPDNVMIGEFGEVLVLDWGLARLVGSSAGGTAQGTPAFMAPEQARGEPVGPPADVWALGTLLHAVLVGAPPLRGGATALLRELRAGRAGEIATGLPPDLGALVAAARGLDPATRPGAPGIAAGLAAWLDGAARRSRALELVAASDALSARAGEAEDRAGSARREAERLVAAIPSWAAPTEKQAAWTQEAEADRWAEEATRCRAQVEQTLIAALTHAPGLAEATDRLGDIYRRELERAEAARDPLGALRAEERLRAYDPGGRHAAWLRGDGALTLHTDPPGAAVYLHPYREEGRRLVPGEGRLLGVSPLDAVPIPQGRYLARLVLPDRPEVRYPVWIRRGAHWDGVPPGGAAPRPVHLPPGDAYDPTSVFVAEGWFWSGALGPPGERDLPGRFVWLDAFFVSRQPVTNAEYLVFLDDLVARGRDAEALAHCPRTADIGGVPGTRIYGRRDDGGFCLQPDADGDLWQPDWPVLMVDHGDALAYAAWRSARDGLAWRLPHELEREKSARGVDARLYPWGDRYDAAFCWNAGSQHGKLQPGSVTAAPLDEGPYGARGMVSNNMDWCANPFRAEGPPLTPDGALLVDAVAGATSFACKGGGWAFRHINTTLTIRWTRQPRDRRIDGGLRLYRSPIPAEALPQAGPPRPSRRRTQAKSPD